MGIGDPKLSILFAWKMQYALVLTVVATPVQPAIHPHPLPGQPLRDDSAYLHYSTLTSYHVAKPAVANDQRERPLGVDRAALDHSRSNVSELGRQVAVNFEPDADFHKCGGCPRHFCFLMFLERPQYRLQPSGSQAPSAAAVGRGVLPCRPVRHPA